MVLALVPAVRDRDRLRPRLSNTAVPADGVVQTVRSGMVGRAIFRLDRSARSRTTLVLGSVRAGTRLLSPYDLRQRVPLSRDDVVRLRDAGAGGARLAQRQVSRVVAPARAGLEADRGALGGERSRRRFSGPRLGDPRLLQPMPARALPRHTRPEQRGRAHDRSPALHLLLRALPRDLRSGEGAL